MSDPLTEFVDAEFFVMGVDSPTAEQTLLDALQGQAGIAEVQIATGRVDVRYEPIAITKKEIGQRIESAGFQIREIECAATSPMTDLESTAHFLDEAMGDQRLPP